MCEPMRVRVEVWPIAADDKGLWLLSGLSPWTTGNIPSDGSAHDELEYLLFSTGALDKTILMHSTSWRQDGPAVLLTYVAVLGCGDLAIDQWRNAVPISAAVVDTVGLPAAGPAVDPPVVRHLDVLLHALRHVRQLLDTDAGAQAVLDERWRRHLAEWKPALAGMYQRTTGS